MRGQRTIAQYRLIDLGLFALMLLLFETVLYRAGTGWFPAEAYMVSVTPVITAVVLMRWGPWGAIHAALGGCLICWLSGGGAAQYVIYGAGSLLGLAALPLREKLGPETIRGDSLKTLLFGLCVALGMDVGRGLVSLLFGAGPAVALGFVTTDTITCLFTLVVLWIVRRLDGVFEDQRHYLSRVQQEQEEKRGGY